MPPMVSVLAVGTGRRLLSQRQCCVRPCHPRRLLPAPTEAPRPEEVERAQGASSADSFSKSQRAATSLLRGEPRRSGVSLCPPPEDMVSVYCVWPQELPPTLRTRL